MSLAEIQASLPSLTVQEREALQESLFALHEGVSVEEWRAMSAALEEELTDPSPSIPAEQVFSKLEAKYRSNAS